jgi:hypothetical protein
MALLTIFYGFFCFAFIAVQILPPQYKSLITFLGGGCKSLSLDSIAAVKNAILKEEGEDVNYKQGCHMPE